MEADGASRNDSAATKITSGKKFGNFDVNGAERKETGHNRLHERVAIPGEIGNLPGNFVCATRRIQGAAVVLARNTAENTKRKGNQQQYEKNDTDCAKRKRDRGILGNGNKVQQCSDDKERTDEHEVGGQSAASPVGARELLIPRVCHIAADARGE